MRVRMSWSVRRAAVISSPLYILAVLALTVGCQQDRTLQAIDNLKSSSATERLQAILVLAEAADVEGDDQPLPFKRPEEIRHSALADGAIMAGTPQQVAEKLDHFCRDFACTDFILSTHFAGIDPQKSSRSNELFAKHVMPAFRDR